MNLWRPETAARFLSIRPTLLHPCPYLSLHPTRLNWIECSPHSTGQAHKNFITRYTRSARSHILTKSHDEQFQFPTSATSTVLSVGSFIYSHSACPPSSSTRGASLPISSFVGIYTHEVVTNDSGAAAAMVGDGVALPLPRCFLHSAYALRINRNIHCRHVHLFCIYGTSGTIAHCKCADVRMAEHEPEREEQDRDRSGVEWRAAEMSLVRSRIWQEA